jgi:hypothetical protein
LHDDGGPIIDLEGRVVGMVDSQNRRTFLPSSILHKCLEMWRKLKYDLYPQIILLLLIKLMRSLIYFTSCSAIEQVKKSCLDYNFLAITPSVYKYIRCFRFVKQMYLDKFKWVYSNEPTH